MISCIIVDDEQHAIDILVHYIGQTPQLQLVGSTTNPLEALKMAADRKVDLVFLDIHMPELSGIDFIKALGGKSKVILTTAYSEFALESYELDVVDYLLKPIRLPRFLQAVQKAASLIRETATAAPGKESTDDYIFVKTESKGKLLKITLADIDYIESMKELEDHLPRQQFMRVHKSYIIPLARITGIEGNMLSLKGVTEKVLIGENYKAELMELIRNKMIQ
jgi:two-component system LytT family response regulator